MIRIRQNSRGFTLVEVMMAVAIIAILAGVSFIGVNSYMRSMALLERNGIAKEIFVAAQNHLTMAKGQGYFDVTEFGTSYEGNSLYTTGISDTNITGVMLPFGAIDETVRASGTFFIRYQKETARVLDVFYWTNNVGRFDCTGMNSDVFGSAMGVKGDDEKQKTFTDGGGGVLGWFGGESASTLPSDEPLIAPEIEIHNEDILYLKVTNKNTSGQLNVYVEGVKSGAVSYFNYGGDTDDTNKGVKVNTPVLASGSTPKSKYIVLDDITNSNRLFSKINNPSEYAFSDITKKQGAEFIPGEDIRVYAEAFIKGSIAEVGRSAAKTTNSLFQAVETKTEKTSEASGSQTAKTDSTVYIGNFRHFENLFDEKSGMNRTDMGLSVNDSVKAEQTTDLYWNSPASENEDEEHISRSFIRHVDKLCKDVFKFDYSRPSGQAIFGDENSVPDKAVPVSPSYTLEYDGAGFSISDVQINYSGNAGLFGLIKGGSIKDLKLIDFQVLSSGDNGNAGTLVGKMTVIDTDNPHTTDVTNIVAYGSSNSDSYKVTAHERGAAGGLIGSAVCNNSNVDFGHVDACAAALYVESPLGDAGGLIGEIEGPMTVMNSYSGGHTIPEKGCYHSDNKYWNTETEAKEDKVNVIGGACAGGLIGDAGGSKGGVVINTCYSTCSVFGTGTDSYVGGLVGSIKKLNNSGSIVNSYSVGFVSGANQSGRNAEDSSIRVLNTIGAFAGSLDTVEPSGCKYYLIVNERYSEEDGIQYLYPVGIPQGDSIAPVDVTALDGTISSYDSFCGNNDSWTVAEPYDSFLSSHYQNKYNLKSVARLAGNTKDGVLKENENAFVLTHYGDWPAPEIFVINI